MKTLPINSTLDTTPAISVSTPILHANWLPVSDTVTRTIVDNSTQTVLATRTWPTTEINRQIEYYLQLKTTSDLDLLKRYATWQRKYIDFQATYAALLHGAITEDEFEKDAEQYAPNIRDVNSLDLVPEIVKLKELLEFDLRASELADYFETEQSTVNKALEEAYAVLENRSLALGNTPKNITD